MATHNTAIHWFRKGLRLHDNPALLAACTNATKVIPLFVLDPHFANPGVVASLRYQFLLETLTDLDTTLRKNYNTQLYVARGTPSDVLPRLVKQLNATLLTYEHDTEPYAKSRDRNIVQQMKSLGVTVDSHWSHTLHNLEHLSSLCQDKPPTVYQSFIKNIFLKAGPVPKPEPLPTTVPSPFSTTDDMNAFTTAVPDMGIELGVPTLEEMGYPSATPCPFTGGETVGLERMHRHLERKQWILSFEKPKTSPNSLSASTTVLSPYLKFGCVSVRTFWWELEKVYASNASGNRSLPPTSLDGQLL